MKGLVISNYFYYSYGNTTNFATLVKNRVKTDCLLNSGHGVLNYGDATILRVDKPRMTISSKIISKLFHIIKYNHD